MAVMEHQSFEGLRGALLGDVIDSSDMRYEQARQVYNAMINRHPAVIARCRDEADVRAAVDFARSNGLTIAVRGGGHNAAGLGVWDDSLVVDLSEMRGVRVDPDSNTVRVEGGCTWKDVDHATHAFGLAVPCGTIASTGVAGLTLGGGIGHLTRHFGLTIDNLLDVDMVLADGRFVTANAKSHPDLFWAVRGGGGNFGVVTSFLYQAHTVSMVHAGPILYPLERVPEVLRFAHQLSLNAPRELNAFFAVLTVPPVAPFPVELHLRKVCGIVCCYSGADEMMQQAFAPFESLGEPLINGVMKMPLPAWNSAFDPLYPAGLQWYWRGHYIKDFPDEAVAVHAKFAEMLPSMHSTMHMYPINGAAHDVGKNDTAFSYRDANYSMVIVGVDPDPANAQKVTDWTRMYSEAIKPYAEAGGYVNFMMEEGEGRVKASYRDNYERLSQIKAIYDPHNLFHVNQNIQPHS